MEKKLKIICETFCQEVIYSNSHIRFVAILNKNGTRIAGGYRKKISSFLTPDEVKMSLHFAKKRWDDRGNLGWHAGVSWIVRGGRGARRQ